MIIFLIFSVPEFRVRCICHALNNVHEVGVVDEKAMIPRVRKLVKTVKRPKAKKQFRGEFVNKYVSHRFAIINEGL